MVITMPKRTTNNVSLQTCPQCEADRLQRQASGIWECKRCGTTVAGGSFEADTGAEETIEKAIREGTEELEEIQEQVIDE